MMIYNGSLNLFRSEARLIILSRVGKMNYQHDESILDGYDEIPAIIDALLLVSIVVHDSCWGFLRLGNCACLSNLTLIGRPCCLLILLLRACQQVDATIKRPITPDTL